MHEMLRLGPLRGAGMGTPSVCPGLGGNIGSVCVPCLCCGGLGQVSAN